LDALRYLISRLDARRMAGGPAPMSEPESVQKPTPVDQRILAEPDESGFWIPLN
jgi:hypothetical protein